MKTFTTNKGREARLVGRKSKYVNGAGCYKAQVNIDGEWKTVVSNCYGGKGIIEKIKNEY